MPYKKYNSSNNAFAAFNLPIADTDVTCVLKWKFWRFPTSNFIMKATHVENGVVTGRENIYVTTRTGATCTGLIRAYEPVPTDDDATTNIQQALNFSADDIVEVVVSSEFMKDMQEEIYAKLAKSGWLREWFWADKHVRVNRSSGNEESKNVTTWTSLVWTDLLRVEKASWDYEDISFNILQSSLSPQTLAYQSRFYPIEDLLANDAIFEYVHPTISQTVGSYFNVWDVAWNAIVTLAKRISSGISGNSITIRTDKVSAAANFWIRIVTCDASGNPTTSVVHANATQFVTAASVTAGGWTTVITFPWSFTCWTVWSLVAIQVCQGTSFASTTVNAGQYYKVLMTTGLSEGLATELQATSTAWWSLIGAGTYSFSTTFTAARRCQITKIEFWYTAAIGMNISISSGWRTWTKTLTVAATLVTIDAPFSIESWKTISISWSGASWSNWNATSWAWTSSLDVTAAALPQWPWFCRLYSLYALDLPATCTMVMDWFVKKSRAMEIITSFVSGICSSATSKWTKPSFMNWFVPWFSALSRIPYFVSTVAWLISWTDNLWAVGLWVTPTILDTDQNVLFRNSWAVRGLDGEIFFAGGSFRYVLATAAASTAVLKWAWDLVNPTWQTIESLGASTSVDKMINLPKWFLQLTYTWTVSTNQFHF